MNPAIAQLILFVVIIMCGFVIATSTGPMKVLAFVIGIVAAGLTIYLHWRKQ